MSDFINIDQFRKNRCSKSPDSWHKYIMTRLDKFTVEFKCKLCGNVSLYSEKE